jgi:hypothetical protein
MEFLSVGTRYQQVSKEQGHPSRKRSLIERFTLEEENILKTK